MIVASQKSPTLISLELELVEKLLQIYGSLLYVYDSKRLQQTIAQITNSIPYPHTNFYFASVTNGNISLLKIFRKAGWELLRIVLVGIPAPYRLRKMSRYQVVDVNKPGIMAQTSIIFQTSIAIAFLGVTLA